MALQQFTNFSRSFILHSSIFREGSLSHVFPFLATFSQIYRCSHLSEPNGLNKTYGFVDFLSTDGADRAVQQRNQLLHPGKFWNVLNNLLDSFFVYWLACVKAHNPFTKFPLAKYFCIFFLGPCTAWNLQSRFDASLRLGTHVVERWLYSPMPCYLDFDSILGFCFSQKVLVHQQITCWKEPTTELTFRKFLLLALSFPNSFCWIFIYFFRLPNPGQYVHVSKLLPQANLYDLFAIGEEQVRFFLFIYCFYFFGNEQLMVFSRIFSRALRSPASWRGPSPRPAPGEAGTQSPGGSEVR